MVDVALHVELGLFTIGRSRQGHDPIDTRTYPLRDGFNDTALASAVAPLKDNDDALSGVFDPFLQVAQFGLQVVEFLLVLFPFKLWPFSGGRLVLLCHDVSTTLLLAEPPSADREQNDCKSDKH